MGNHVLWGAVIFLLTTLFLPQVAAQDSEITPAVRMNMARECFTLQKCESLKIEVAQTSSALGGTEEQGMQYERQLFDACPVAHEPMPPASKSDNLIIHNYKLSECFSKIMDITPESVAGKQPVSAAADLAMFAGLYFSTEYDLGHISGAQYRSYSNSAAQIAHALDSTEKTESQQAQEIQTLQAQLAKLSSQDHERCRAIQAEAAMNGGVPPVCN